MVQPWSTASLARAICSLLNEFARPTRPIASPLTTKNPHNSTDGLSTAAEFGANIPSASTVDDRHTNFFQALVRHPVNDGPSIAVLAISDISEQRGCPNA
jgi:hypothetical protein